ncbi:unnamed protein product [Laminaria digitata]
MVQAGISRDILSAAVAKSALEFRHGHGELFGWLENERVPLLLFSAGIADVLEEALKQRSEKPVPSNCHIISNRMAFDEEGMLTGFEGECLHVFNKHASSPVVAPYFQTEEMRRRGNVVLLGDSLGDLNMANGVGSGEVLTVGFLNDKVEERLDTYTSECLRRRHSGGWQLRLRAAAFGGRRPPKGLMLIKSHKEWCLLYTRALR